ncbi:Annexin [Pseudovirgaria hyperparasitica]|uniref:Annexin n=1 Tax=Pseudovirgaria hyperparasitica TaxID=470096 RepID=A0A6A6W8W1_9PEZI|nr:Annexin [Pseudovirgaria hyperparasitica]KAF2757531.1 Annexin [Pseudovirgaria hyperparasitica]
MSLRPDDRKGRSRSKSPAGRSRDRSSSNVRVPKSDALAYGQPPPGGFETRTPTQAAPGLASYANSAMNMMSGALGGSDPSRDDSYTMGDYADLPPHERPGYVATATPVAGGKVPYQYAPNAGLAGQPYPPPVSRTISHGSSASGSAGGYQYATTPGNITYTAKSVVPQPGSSNGHSNKHSSKHGKESPQHQAFYTQPDQFYPQPPPSGPPHGHHHMPGGFPAGNVVEVIPGGGRIASPPSPGKRPHSMSLSTPGHGPELRAPSPGFGLGNRMDRLSVSGNRPNIQTLVPGGMPSGGGGMLPPPSPMLEAYHGVYQSISPMPSPMMHAYHPHDSDLEDLPPLSPRYSHAGHHRTLSAYSRESSPARSTRTSRSKSSKSKSSKSSKKDDRDRGERRVKIYDATEDAHAIVAAMSHRQPDVFPLIDILPQLNHDQMLELRTEYKRHCKVQGHGINVAKHIKMKTSGNFGKLCYVTALGRWESEGYWANTWYQSGNARRELLVECLMGRGNVEMREIKAAFKDKRYNDDLVRCMEKELKADKFRKAVLLALEGRRQEEREQWPIEYRNRDVDTLYTALKAREGGETAILELVIKRSDAHLRDVLRTYEVKFQENFAREALRKSNNLVGEVVAHILNGVINRPARDAMLLHHAIEDLSDRTDSRNSKHERQQRYELLISRIVRLHWDKMHMMRVKVEFEKKYRLAVEEALEDSVREDFLEFCLALVE